MNNAYYDSSKNHSKIKLSLFQINQNRIIQSDKQEVKKMDHVDHAHDWVFGW